MICQCTIADELCGARESWSARCQNVAVAYVPMNFTRERIVYAHVCQDHFDELMDEVEAA